MRTNFDNGMKMIEIIGLSIHGTSSAPVVIEGNKGTCYRIIVILLEFIIINNCTYKPKLCTIVET